MSKYNKHADVAHAIPADMKRVALAGAMLAAGLMLGAGNARAESNFVSGAGTATAHLDFQVVIPKFVFLQVGSGTPLASLATINTIGFDLTATPAVIGNAAPQNATSGGDISTGVVTAKVIGNNFTAAVNLSATTAGAMSDGAGDTISWSEITVATAANGTATTLAHPGTLVAPFADGAATTVSLTPVSKVINQAAKWTFTYKNTNVPAAGTFGGTVAKNGEVTYSITMP